MVTIINKIDVCFTCKFCLITVVNFYTENFDRLACTKELFEIIGTYQKKNKFYNFVCDALLTCGRLYAALSVKAFFEF